MSLRFHDSLIFRPFNAFMVISLMMLPYSSQASQTPIQNLSLSGPPRQPCQTSIPAPLRPPKDITPLGCDRPFTIHGETYSTDSPQAQDASTLKYFVQNVPASNSILEEYQSHRFLSRTSAYIGTLGIVMFLLSNTIAKQFNAPSQTSVRNSLRIGGLVMATSGFFFTFAYLHENEKLIPQAVNVYNQSKPTDPIELQFTTGWKF